MRGAGVPRTTIVNVIVALGFAIAVVGFGSRLALPIPLYVTSGCPGNYCFPNIPELPLVPLAAAIVVVLWWTRGARVGASRLVVGLALGVAASLYSGLVVVAAIPFHDAYFTAPYKLYALAFLGAVTFVFVAVPMREPRGGPRPGWTWALLAVVAVTIAAVFIRREWPVAAVSLIAAVLGAAAGARMPGSLSLVRWMTEVRLLAGIVALSFTFRALFGLQTLARTGPGMAFAVASDDGDSYYQLGTSLAAGGGIDVWAASAFPPGYSTFLGAIFALTRSSLVAVVVAQSLLAAVATLVVYAVGRDLAGRRVGMLAAVLFAADANLIQNQATLTAESLLMPLVLVALWSVARYARTDRTGWLLVGAAALAGAYVTRNLVAIPLSVATLVWLLVIERGRLRRFARDAALLVGAIVIATLPIAYATGVKEGTPRLTTQLASLAWDFEGGPGYTVSNKPLVDRNIHPFTDPLGSAARVLADPLPVLGFYAYAVPQRLSTLLFFSPVGLADPILIVNGVVYPNEYGDVVRIVRLLALVTACIALVARRSWRTHPEIGLLAGFTLLYLAAFSLIFPPYHAFRYRIPIEPLRFVAEAAGLALFAGAVGTAWSTLGPRPGAEEPVGGGPAAAPQREDGGGGPIGLPAR